MRSLMCLCVLLSAVCVSLSAQEILYSENFDTVPHKKGLDLMDQPDSIRVGQGYAFIGDAVFTSNPQWFRVDNPMGNAGRMEARQTNQGVFWKSDTIDIRCYEDVRIQVDLSEQGNQRAQDSIAVYYIVNGGAEALADVYYGNFDPVTLDSGPIANLCGLSSDTSLQVVIRLRNGGAGGRYHHFDNLVVDGTELPATALSSFSVVCSGTVGTITATGITACTSEYGLSEDGVPGKVYNTTGVFPDLEDGFYTLTIRDATFTTCDSLLIAIPLGCSALPITLVDFSGHPENGMIRLHWQTDGELNNDYMVVERSADAVDFSELGRLNGAGTTQQTQFYQFLDRHPLAGTNYYRLRQVDTDGRATYHHIIAVDPDRREETGELVLYPTISRSTIQVRPGLEAGQQLPYAVFDMVGKLVRQGSWSPTAIDESHELSVMELPAGAYVLQVQAAGRLLTGRFVVAK